MSDVLIKPVQILNEIWECHNWYIHILYTHGDVISCLKVIENKLRRSSGICEYPLYVKGLIMRGEGKLQESLSLFEAATALSPGNPENLKQVGRSLYLLARFKEALEVYQEAMKCLVDISGGAEGDRKNKKTPSGEKGDANAQKFKAYSSQEQHLSIPLTRMSSSGRDLLYSCGICYANLAQYQDAEKCFRRANLIQKCDETYLQLCRLYTKQERYEDAIDSCLDCLESNQENPTLLSTAGLLYLRVGQNQKALEYLFRALALDNKDFNTVLAVSSAMQVHNNHLMALNNYRPLLASRPHSVQLWNNIGMCFFGRGDFLAAIACLRKAFFFSPFEWIVSFNLGFVFLHAGMYLSAFHHLSAASRFKPDVPLIYMYLGIALNHLGDFANACAAYDHAIHMMTIVNLPLDQELESDSLSSREYVSNGTTLGNAPKPTTAATELSLFTPHLPIRPSDDTLALDNLSGEQHLEFSENDAYLFFLNYAVMLYNYGTKSKTTTHKNSNGSITIIDDSNKNYINKCRKLLLLAERLWAALPLEERESAVCTTTSIIPEVQVKALLLSKKKREKCSSNSGSGDWKINGGNGDERDRVSVEEENWQFAAYTNEGMDVERVMMLLDLKLGMIYDKNNEVIIEEDMYIQDGVDDKVGSSVIATTSIK